MEEKSLYRAAHAYYRLGRFSECLASLLILNRKYPDNAEAAREISKAKLRLEEQQTGTFNFKSLYKEASKLRPPQLDHATFVGPVKVQMSPGRGRGLFTTRPVKAGELLLCEKAFAHCYVDPTEESRECSKPSILINVYTNRMTEGAQGDLIQTIVQKLWKNPSLLPGFMELYHGDYDVVDIFEVDGKPVVDT